MIIRSFASLVAALDPLGELDLLLGGQQRVAAGLVQEELERVGGRGREVAVDEGRVVLADVAAVVAELDPALLELLVDARELVVVEVELLDELAELRQVDAALLLGPVDQRCQSVHTALQRSDCPIILSPLTAVEPQSKPQYLAVFGHGQKPRVRYARSATHICSSGVQWSAVPFAAEELAAVRGLELEVHLEAAVVGGVRVGPRSLVAVDAEPLATGAAA